MADQWVLASQHKTFGSVSGWTKVTEDGSTGQGTVYGLIEAHPEDNEGVPTQLYRPPRLASALAAGGLILVIVLALVAAVFGGLWWFGSAVGSGARSAAASSSSEYGACDDPSPWSCQAVPQRTVEAKFGREIPSGASVLTAEAEPTAGVTGQPQIQVVFESPGSGAADDWLALVGASVSPVADASRVPELGDLGVARIRGGTADDVSVFAGDLNGHQYVWAYRKL